MSDCDVEKMENILSQPFPDIDMGVDCPGCERELTTENAGGYRTFCKACVNVFPTFPKDGKGHLIKEGCKYPNFEWD